MQAVLNVLCFYIGKKFPLFTGKFKINMDEILEESKEHEDKKQKDAKENEKKDNK